MLNLVWSCSQPGVVIRGIKDDQQGWFIFLSNFNRVFISSPYWLELYPEGIFWCCRQSCCLVLENISVIIVVLIGCSSLGEYPNLGEPYLPQFSSKLSSSHHSTELVWQPAVVRIIKASLHALSRSYLWCACLLTFPFQPNILQVQVPYWGSGHWPLIRLSSGLLLRGSLGSWQQVIIYEILTSTAHSTQLSYCCAVATAFLAFSEADGAFLACQLQNAWSSITWPL